MPAVLARAVALHHYPTLDSTQSQARRLLAVAARPLVVSATQQRAGRGRLARRWLSPPGGLYLTIAWPVPAVLAQRPQLLSAAVGLAALEALRPWSTEPALKWPNDLIARGRKLGGMLAELVPPGLGHDAAQPFALIGLGLNVAVRPAGELRWPPICLWDLLHGSRPDVRLAATPTAAPSPSSSPARATPPAPVGNGLRLVEAASDPATAASPGVPPFDRGSAAFTLTAGDPAGRDGPGPDLLRARLVPALTGELAALEEPAAVAAMLARYRTACATIGQPVTIVLDDVRPDRGAPAQEEAEAVRPADSSPDDPRGPASRPDHVLSGVAVGVDDELALLLETPRGPRAVSFGDCYHLT